MADIRIKDLPDTTEPADGDEFPIDSLAAGTRKTTFLELKTTIAADFVAAPTTFKLVPLDGSNKIPTTYMPAGTLSGTDQGDHDAATNTPTVVDGTGTLSDYYTVTVGGTRNYGSGNITLAAGDLLRYDGSVWYKVPGIANILNGISVASTARTTLEVFSEAEVAHRVAPKAPGRALSFDGDDYVDLTDLALLEPAEDEDFTVSGYSYFPTSGSTLPLFDKRAAGGLGYNVRIDSGGNLGGYLQDSGGGTAATADGADLSGGWHRWMATFDRNGNLTRYVDTNDVYGTADDISSRNGDLAVAQTARIGNDDSSNFFEGQIGAIQVWNTIPTSADINLYMANGVVPPAYQHAQTAYVGDYSAGVDGMISYNATLAGNIDSIGGVNDTLRNTSSATSSAFAYVFGSTDLPKGTRWRVKGRFYMPAANTTAEELEITFGSGNSVIVNTAHSSDSWVSFDETFSAPSSGREIRLWLSDSSGDRFGNTSGDIAYLVDFEFGPVGVTWDGDFNAVDHVNAVVPDRTGFGNNGAITGAKTAHKARGLHIDAPTPAANEKLLTVCRNGTEVASLDEDGDLDVATISSGDWSEVTISSGAISVTQDCHTVDTESDASTDDLATINGTRAGQIITLRPANSSRDVVAKDGTGNLKLAGDFTMDNAEDTLTLRSDGTNLYELCRSNNGA